MTGQRGAQAAVPRRLESRALISLAAVIERPSLVYAFISTLRKLAQSPPPPSTGTSVPAPPAYTDQC